MGLGWLGFWCPAAAVVFLGCGIGVGGAEQLWWSNLARLDVQACPGLGV